MIASGAKPIRAPKSKEPAKLGGGAGVDRVGAEEILDDFLQDDGEAEGDQDLVGVRALVEMLDQAALHREADHEHDRNGEKDGERHRPVDDRRSDIVAEPAVDIGHLHLERVAQEILPGRVDLFEWTG